MDYRSPLSRVRGLGSAKTGTTHWWMQRISAVVLIPLSFWLILFVSHLSGSSYQQTIEWVAEPLNSVFLIFWIIAVFYHAALGVQVVIEDYVHTEWLKITSVWVVKLAFLFLALVALLATFRIVLLG